jgi:hypothetical protein
VVLVKNVSFVIRGVATHDICLLGSVQEVNHKKELVYFHIYIYIYEYILYITFFSRNAISRMFLWKIIYFVLDAAQNLKISFIKQ